MKLHTYAISNIGECEMCAWHGTEPGFGPPRFLNLKKRKKKEKKKCQIKNHVPKHVGYQKGYQ
jgi:hypothetical protein